MDSEGNIKMVPNSRAVFKANSVGSSLKSPGKSPLRERSPESVAEVPPPQYVRKRPSDYELSVHRFQMI